MSIDLTSGLAYGLVYSLLALGFRLDAAGSGYLNVALGDMLVICAYGSAVLGAPCWSAPLVILASTYVRGVAHDHIFLQTVHPGESPIRALLSGIGIALFLSGTIDLFLSGYSGELLLSKEPLVHAVSERVGISWQYVLIIPLAVPSLFALVLFSRSRSGRALSLLADNYRLSKALGLPVENLGRIGRRIGCMAFGLGGVLSLTLADLSSARGLRLSLLAYLIVLASGHSAFQVFAVSMCLGIVERLMAENTLPFLGFQIEQMFAQDVALGLLAAFSLGRYLRRAMKGRR